MHSHLYTIPAYRNFTENLLDGLQARGLLFSDNAVLPNVRLFVPHRRGQQVLFESIYRRAKKTAMIMPEITPLGDIDLGDEDVWDAHEPHTQQISKAERRMRLAELLQAYFDKKTAPARPTPAQLLHLSDQLAGFIDRWQSHKASFTQLKQLMQESGQDHARHCQDMLAVLAVGLRQWKNVKQQDNRKDQQQAQEDALERLADNLPKDKQVIIAGSSGTRPAVRYVMRAVLQQKRGFVILPALDTDMDESAWQRVLTEDHMYHPQFALAELLANLGVTRKQVTAWQPMTDDHKTRAKAQRLACIQHCFAIDGVTSRQQHQQKTDHVLEGLRLVECADEREEAHVIACLVAESVHHQQSVAVITPDATIARRIKTELAYWHITADDALGVPISQTPTMVFLRLIRDAVCEPDLATLLAVMRHPCAAFWQGQQQTRLLSRRIEKAFLRGIINGTSLRQWQQLIRQSDKPYKQDADALETAAAALEQFQAVLAKNALSLPELLRAHIECAEALSTKRLLWQQQEFSDQIAHFLRRQLLAYGGCFPVLAGRDYGGLFDALLAGTQLRRQRRQADVALYGAWEARMQTKQRVIVTSMNEQLWPKETIHDMWLPTASEKKLGLARSIQRNGLAAHDFVHIFAADEVILSRAKRMNGTPQTESTFITRLKGTMPKGYRIESDTDMPSIAKRIDARKSQQTQIPPPHPPQIKAPKDHRLQKLSISNIMTLRDKPYQFYATKILKLKPLDPLNKMADSADIGKGVHEVCARFFADHCDQKIDNMQAWVDDFVKCGLRPIETKGYRPAFRYFYAMRLRAIALWLIDHEEQKRQQNETLWKTEIEGAIDIDGITLQGRADRIQAHQDGLILIDYKTGNAPALKAIQEQKDIQLTLEALLASQNGFGDDQPSQRVQAWRYMKLSERKRQALPPPVGKVIAFPEKDDDSVTGLLEACENNLRALLAHYRRADAVYDARLDDEGDTRTGKPFYLRCYDHLTRRPEWQASEDNDA